MSGPDIPHRVVSGLTGVLFESADGTDHDFHGYVRVGGVEYKLLARREDDWGGRRRWVLRLSPHSNEGCAPREEAI